MCLPADQRIHFVSIFNYFWMKDNLLPAVWKDSETKEHKSKLLSNLQPLSWSILDSGEHRIVVKIRPARQKSWVPAWNTALGCLIFLHSANMFPFVFKISGACSLTFCFHTQGPSLNVSALKHCETSLLGCSGDQAPWTSPPAAGWTRAADPCSLWQCSGHRGFWQCEMHPRHTALLPRAGGASFLIMTCHGKVVRFLSHFLASVYSVYKYQCWCLEGNMFDW